MKHPLHQLHEDDIQSNEVGKRWIDLVRNYVLDIREITFTWNPVSVAANTTVELSVTVSGLKSNDIVLSLIKPSLDAGLGVLQARVSADDTLSVQLINVTGSPIDAGSETYQLVYIKNSRL